MNVTKDKILSAAEADDLEAFLEERVRRASGDDRDSAELDELIVVALLLSGLRNSEFCSLRLADAVLRSGEPVFNVGGASERSRVVYIPRRLREIVLRYVDGLRPRLLPGGMDPRDQAQPLVLSENRRPYERTGLYRRVVRILTEAGLGDRASVQLLRHTYGYLAYLRTGGNLLFVQRQLGHVHPRITSAYAALVHESYADLAERIVPAERPTASLVRKTYIRRQAEFDCEID